MKMLNHPHILKYFTSTDVDSALCIVTEYCSNGDLSMLLQNRKLNMKDDDKYFPEQIIIEWFRQTTSALEYLHAIPILHRDVKTNNIFLTDEFQTKLGDFGLAKVLEGPDSRAKTYCGSIYYMSPEILSGKPYDHKSDIWALGVVIYEIVTLTKPFDALLTYQIVSQILNDNLPVLLSNYSTDLCNLMSVLLNKEHDKRPSAREILENEIFKRRLQEHQEMKCVCSKSKSGRITDKREKYSGPFDMAKILEEMSKSHCFVEKREYTISEILKHIIDITKDVSTEVGICETAHKDMMERLRQSVNHTLKPCEMLKNDRDKVYDTIRRGGRDTTAIEPETDSISPAEGGLDRFRRRVNHFFKVFLSRSFHSQASIFIDGVSDMKCDGCGLTVSNVLITVVKERSYCRACLDNDCDDDKINTKEVKHLKVQSTKEFAMTDSLQPSNDTDVDELHLPYPTRNVTRQTAIDKDFERMVLTGIKHARDSSDVRPSAPIDSITFSDCHDGSNEPISISADTKERLHFVYETVDIVLEDNHTPSDTDSRLRKDNELTKTPFKMPKSKQKVPDANTQIKTMRENRLAFLNKMKQSR